MDFEAFIKDVHENNWEVFGAEVYEQEILMHSYGDTEKEMHAIYSAAKSILSIAVGIARDRGQIDLYKSVLAYLPHDKVLQLSPAQKAIWEPISLHRLLTMSVSDLPFRAEGESWLDFSLACPIRNPEQRKFTYSNISAYLTGIALTGALGRDVGTFIEETIFSPLGIERYEYSRCPEGFFYGASGMKLTVHDLSKIGMMLYNDGIWKGKRIVSDTYIREATALQQMCREGGYGYFFWKTLDGFSINGKWGQRCYVLPERGMVITCLSHVENDTRQFEHGIKKHLLGEMV